MPTCYRNFPSIEVKGSEDYEKSVVEQLDKVWDTWTGWSVMRAIIDSGKAVTIVPLLDDDVSQALGQRRAFARPKDRLAAAPKGADRYAGGVDDLATDDDERFRIVPGAGVGAGSNCEIHFSPSDYAVLPVCSKVTPTNCVPAWFSRDRGADNTLIHELLHALRQILGQMNQIPTRTQGYDNQEEFFAMILENTYASERGKTVLSAGHHGGNLAGLMVTSAGFLGKGQKPLTLLQLENRLLVRRFTNENPNLCRELATRVTATFHPIQEFLGNPKLYPYDPKAAFPYRR